MRIKQVILIRRDLKMRRGKEIAQGSHASMDFLVERLRIQLGSIGSTTLELSEEERLWVGGGMAKICLQVHSEDELLGFHKHALQLGLTSHLIQDSGRTEFQGKATFTACAIGPHEFTRIDAITAALEIY